MSDQEWIEIGDLVRLCSPTKDVVPLGYDVSKGFLQQVQAKHFELGLVGIALENGEYYIDVKLEEGIYRFMSEYVEKVNEDV